MKSKDIRSERSQSQRLRFVLYKIWEKKKKGSFEDYYENAMEKIIKWTKTL